MGETSKIEWTDSTFNPWVGCTKVGPGCDHCYAEAMMDKRYGKARWGAGQPRVRTSAANWKKPRRWSRDAFWACTDSSCGWRGDQKALDAGTTTSTIERECPECGEQVEAARRRVFCASLADVFDNEVDPAWREHLFNLIDETPNLDWLLLTKRIGNVARMEPADWAQGNWPENVWLGATVVNQEEADRDIPKLLAVPARVRFLSIEPMLGPVDLHIAPAEKLDHTLFPLDWIIAGGESQDDARPMHPDWVRSLRDQCKAAGVPFLFKQWGEWAPHYPSVAGDLGGDLRRGKVQHLHADGNPEGFFRRGDCYVGHVGKKAAGRLLDGREWNGFPS